MTKKKSAEISEAFISCAKKLFQEHGYNKTSIRMITEEMGFKNQASFYIYFKSKDHLTALILDRNSEKVHAYIQSLEWKNATPLHLLMLENLIISQILKDEANRRFYSEAQWQQSLKSMMKQVPNYSNSLYQSVASDKEDITLEELELNLFAYVKAFCSVCQAIDNKETSVSYQEAIKKLPYVFLDLMGVDRKIHESIVSETMDVFRKIPEEAILKLYFFSDC